MPQQTGRFKFRSFVSVTAIVTLVTTIATLAANGDKILDFASKWLIPYLRTSADLVVRLDEGVKRDVIVAITRQDDKQGVLDAQTVASGRSVTFRVPVSSRYTVIWQGSGVRAESVKDVLAPVGGARWLLSVAQRDGDQDILVFRLEGATEQAAKTEPSAASLIASLSAQGARAPAAQPPAAGLVPELDRAMLIVGLFETGTTDCHGKVFVNQVTISVGCLGAGLPGWLQELITGLDTGEAGALDGLPEGDRATLRALVSPATDSPLDRRARLATPEARAAVQSALVRLNDTTAFRLAYQRRTGDAYRMALATARHLGLVEERSVLFLFDRLIWSGPGSLARLERRYGETYQDSVSEDVKLDRLATLSKQTASPTVRPFNDRRVEALVTGRATVGGIVYDLAQLGVKGRWPLPKAGPAP